MPDVSGDRFRGKPLPFHLAQHAFTEWIRSSLESISVPSKSKISARTEGNLALAINIHSNTLSTESEGWAHFTDANPHFNDANPGARGPPNQPLRAFLDQSVF